MPKTVPWKSLEEAIATLSERREVLSRQIEALRSISMSPQIEVVLVLQYVVLASAKGVAEWANEQGLTLPGAKGEPRRYTARDILALIAKPPDAVGPELRALVRHIFEKNTKQVLHSFG